MKKFLILTIVTALAFSAKAQVSTNFGIKAGVNHSNMTCKDYSESFRRPGYYAGGLADISFSEKFSIQPEVLYAHYGAVIYMKLAGAPPHETYYDLDYILVPLAAKFQIGRSLSLEIGPSFNLLVRGKYYIPGLPDIVDQDGNFLYSQSEGEPFGGRFELSGFAGITYELCSSWALSARYTQGISSAFGIRHEGERNNAFQLGVNYMFQGKK